MSVLICICFGFCLIRKFEDNFGIELVAWIEVASLPLFRLNRLQAPGLGRCSRYRAAAFQRIIGGQVKLMRFLSAANFGFHAHDRLLAATGFHMLESPDHTGLFRRV